MTWKQVSGKDGKPLPYFYDDVKKVYGAPEGWGIAGDGGGYYPVDPKGASVLEGDGKGTPLVDPASVGFDYYAALGIPDPDAQNARYGKSLLEATNSAPTKFRVFGSTAPSVTFTPFPKDEGLFAQFTNPDFMHFVSAVGASFGLAGLAGQFAGGLSSLTPAAAEEMTALGGFPGATPIASTSSFSFGDILANQFSPQNIATSLAKTGITSAITGQKLTPEGIATGLVGGAVGSAASSAVGGGAVGSIASTAASTGTQAALSGMINDGGGQIGNTAPSSPPISAQTVNAATPGSNAVPGSFSLILSPFTPQFHRNT